MKARLEPVAYRALLALAIMASFLTVFSIGYHFGEQDGRAEIRKTTTTTVQVCEEDMPCWNCAVMGNRRCGAEGK